MNGLGKYIRESLLDTTDTDFDAVVGAFEDGIIDQKRAAEVFGTDIVDLVIPEGITEIGDRAFDEYKRLRSVTFPSTLVTIGFSAFVACKNLEEVTWAEDSKAFRKIDHNVFASCPKLTRLDIPDSTEFLGSKFIANSGVTDLHIPENLKDVYIGAFSGIRHLEKLDLSGTEFIRIVDSMFYSSTGLKEVILPGTCTMIGGLAFADCTHLEVVRAPGCLRVRDSAFDGCFRLSTVELAPGVIMGTKAFNDCRCLREFVNPIGGALNKTFTKSGIRKLYWDGSDIISLSAIKTSDISRVVLTTPVDKLKARVRKNIEELKEENPLLIKYEDEKTR